MKTIKKTCLFCLLVLCCFALLGCGKKADENKPVSEVQAEAETMNAEQLRKIAMQYKDAVLAKSADIEKITATLKEIPVTELLGNEAKGLKTEIDNLNKSISDLTERFQIYYDKLKEKGGDLTGLEL
ncbi:hypothetical protein ACFL1G_08885 [Planctomycetota bacterium]